MRERWPARLPSRRPAPLDVTEFCTLQQPSRQGEEGGKERERGRAELSRRRRRQKKKFMDFQSGGEARQEFGLRESELQGCQKCQSFFLGRDDIPQIDYVRPRPI